jgi:hypothetical protein
VEIKRSLKRVKIIFPQRLVSRIAKTFRRLD